jgi:NAD(P)-dependent dehydrogenase (short-subunit alcohol dehydrogenase family)
MKKLEGKVAVVAGASRGAARGIALALGDAGATVYAAARTSEHGAKPADNAPGSVEDTARELTSRGGLGIPVTADLSDESQVAALFRRVQEEQGRLDLLANAAWCSHVVEHWGKPFWKLSSDLWRDTMRTLDTYWLTGVYAGQIMAEQKRGLIIFITDQLPDPAEYAGQIMWDVGHHALNRLVLAMSHELKKSGVAVVGLNPGFMRTERVIVHMRKGGEKLQRQFRFDLSESTEYVGRAAAALAADDKVMRKSGQLLWGADLAREYGFIDIDGRSIPRFDPNAPVSNIPPHWLELP